MADATVDTREASHHIDSDSGDEWEDADGAALQFTSAVGRVGWSGLSSADDACGEKVTGSASGKGGSRAAALAAAAALEVPLSPPVASYIYVLKRRKS